MTTLCLPVMNLNLLVTFLYTISILIFGFLSDYVDKKIFLVAACALTTMLMYPLFTLILTQSVAAQFIGQGMISVLLGMILGPYASIVAESFPTNVRYTGLSIILNISASFFGGSAPMVCNWLTKFLGTPIAPAFYVVSLAVIALIGSVMTLTRLTRWQMVSSVQTI